MSSKHFFPTSEGLSTLALQGLVASSPSLALISATRVVFNRDHPSSKVAVISGGGSGHEPHSSGTVGKGMLSAAVCGDVFASPSAKQVVSAVNACASEQGAVLVVTNYTGDMLHFGLACEVLNARGGAPAACVVVADDVAVGRSKGGLVGRRGLAGTPLTIKILGAAAEASFTFAATLALGKAVVNNLVSIGAGLDHVTLPGRTYEGVKLAANECEIGLGIHNEPGVLKISPVPTPKMLVDQMLNMLLDPNDPERAFVPFSKDDETVLLVNNLGGVSPIEFSGLVALVVAALDSRWKIHPARVLQGTFMTSLDAQSFSITLFNISRASRRPKLAEQLVDFPEEEDLFILPNSGDILFDPKVLEERLRTACANVILLEPKLTEWDTIMGDGDCGTTLETGARATLNALDLGLASTGSLFTVVHRIVQITESAMGGTLGAIFGIYLAGFLSALRSNATLASASTGHRELLSRASVVALDRHATSLRQHTPAKVNDRTVMDVLIPFVEEYAKNCDFDAAVNVAHEAAEGTRLITAKLGRATYVGGLEGKVLPPDPGAFGVYEIMLGLAGRVEVA